MEFFDLKKQYQSLKKEIDAAVLKTLESGIYVGGPQIEEFEKKAAEFIGTKFAVSLNSGTDALYLALKALGIGTGDEVVTTDFTFFATAEAIVATGARPAFVDIDLATFNIDAAKIEAAITPNTKAIIPVHIFGQMADMAAVLDIAKKRNLKVIEDCAQAIGATQTANGAEMKAGAVGDIGCFSFFPTKNLGAYGDGGMVTTNDLKIAAKIKTLKAHGSSPENKYKNTEIGINSRLDAIQSAILNVKMKYLEQWNRERFDRAARYNHGLREVGDIALPFAAPGNSHIYHQFVLMTARRDALAAFLKQKGIPTLVYFPIPMHLQPALGYLGGKLGDYPKAEYAAANVLSLPIYPELEQKEQDLIILAVKEFYGASTIATQ